MVDMRRGCVDNAEERVYETEAVVGEVKSRRCLDPVSINSGGTSNEKLPIPSTILQLFAAHQPLPLLRRGH